MSQDVSAGGQPLAPIPAACCQNSGTALTGPFCSACGQREQSRIVSLGSLVKDAVGDIYHVDSRVWRTLRALVTRPGFLTVEFLAGRRARYLPPFRLYLVVSIVLFLLTQHLRDRDAPPFVATDPAEVQRAYVATQAALAAKRAELARTGEDEDLRAEVDELAQRLDALRAHQVASSKPGAGCEGLNFTSFGIKSIETRARAACRKIAADKGVGLARAFVDNLPKMMFIFLPLLALVNKLLYLRSRRLYVEHLLFFSASARISVSGSQRDHHRQWTVRARARWRAPAGDRIDGSRRRFVRVCLLGDAPRVAAGTFQNVHQVWLSFHRVYDQPWHYDHRHGALQRPYTLDMECL